MIECYYRWCKYHEFQMDSSGGPYCGLNKCVASKEELKIFSLKRKEELKNLKYNYIPITHIGTRP